MSVYDEVENDMTVGPNCVYVIPPNKNLVHREGAFHLLEPTEPRGRRSPIDFFFHSLAEGKNEQAIGIVLSGTGSDGTRFIWEILLKKAIINNECFYNSDNIIFY